MGVAFLYLATGPNQPPLPQVYVAFRWLNESTTPPCKSSNIPLPYVRWVISPIPYPILLVIF